MQSSTSLSGISTFVSGHVPHIIQSPAAVLNTQFAAVTHQFRILQAENSAIRESAKALRGKNDYLSAENEGLRTRTQALLAHNTRLEQDNQNLVDNLHAETTVRLRTSLQDKHRISQLKEAAKQRDFFIRAMVDIKLHHPVLQNAYADINKGSNADQAIITAIQTAANQPGSPWCKLIAQPDITKSDLYLSAIDFAAIARIRLQEHTKLTRFWKHMAKSASQNTGLLTPSPSALIAIDKELEQQDHGIGQLLSTLRANENANSNNEKEPALARPDSSISMPPSPTLAYLQFHRSTLKRNHYRERQKWERVPSLSGAQHNSALQDSTVSPCAPNPPPTRVYSEYTPKAQGLRARKCDPGTPTHSKMFFPCIPPNSLERIHAAFAMPDSESAFNRESLSLPSPNSFIRSISSFSPPLPKQPPAGRGRSATVPFSAKELTSLPVKTVTSKQVILTPRGDREKKAQAMPAHRACLNKGAFLVRSKALIIKKSSGPLRRSNLSRINNLVNAQPMFSAPPLSCNTILSKSTRSFPLTPPPDNELFGPSESYTRPLTVTRKKMVDTLIPARVSTSACLKPPTAATELNPNVAKELNCTVKAASFNSLLIPSTTTDRHASTISQESSVKENLVKDLKNKSRASTLKKSIFIIECEKENIPPKPLSSSNRHFRRNLSHTDARLSAPMGNISTGQRSSSYLSRRPPSVAKSIVSTIQPLNIVKKKLVNPAPYLTPPVPH